MTTIGDSFAIVAILGGIGLTTWALILACGLLFNTKANEARERYEARPWLGFGVGFLVTLTIGFISYAMAASPNPGAKLLGLTGLMALMAISAIGAAGLCQIIAQRIRVLEPNLSPYAAYTRASMFVVVAMFVPLLGWFLLTPALFMTSLGIGTQALFARRRLYAEGA